MVAVAFLIIVFPFAEWVAEIIFRVIKVCNPALTSYTAIVV